MSILSDLSSFELVNLILSPETVRLELKSRLFDRVEDYNSNPQDYPRGITHRWIAERHDGTYIVEGNMRVFDDRGTAMALAVQVEWVSFAQAL